MNFINLTNGLRAIADHGLTDYRFMRIQSTWCEQKRWSDILLTLSDDFLVCAASGEPCIVYDYGANKPIPRSVWQGLEWVKFALWRRWHGVSYQIVGRSGSAGAYFAKCHAGLPRTTKTRLDYYKHFVSGPLDIRAVTASTKELPLHQYRFDHIYPLHQDRSEAFRWD